jgi:hypothetical protein
MFLRARAAAPQLSLTGSVQLHGFSKFVDAEYSGDLGICLIFKVCLDKAGTR